jgi:DEK C terminal domain
MRADGATSGFVAFDISNGIHLTHRFEQPDLMSALDDSQPPTTETALPVDGSKAENGTNPPESVAEPEKATEPQVPPRPLPSDDALLTALRDILKDVDINSVTQGQVRLRLEEHFGQDLSEKKAYIREQLPGLLAERKLPPSPKPSEPKDKARKPAQPKRTAPASEESPAPTKKGRGMFGKELLLSPGLAEFMGETRMSRSEVKFCVPD